MYARTCCLVAVSCFLQLLGCVTWADQEVIHVMHDVYVDESSPNANFNGDYLMVGNFSEEGFGRWTYLKFDLAEIPAEATITGLSLYLWVAMPGQEPITTQVSQTTSDWDEGTLTWNTQPDIFCGAQASVVPDTGGEWWITNVDDWIIENCHIFAGDYVTFAILSYNQAPNMALFVDKEHATGVNWDHGPELAVYYVPGPPTPDPMTWETEPYPTSTTSVRMVATAASHPNGVEYYFEGQSGGGHDRRWDDSREFEDAGLQPGTTYWYQVKARDKTNEQETAYSTRVLVTTPSEANNPPNTPSLTSPSNGAPEVSLTPTLSASSFSDPDSGDTHMSSKWEIAYLETVIWSHEDTDSDKTSETVPSGILVANRCYYWSVQYEDDHGYWSFWADIWSFTTAPQEINPPNKPSLSSPSSGATGISLTPTLSASSFSDADSGDTHAASQWQVDNNADFSSPAWDYTDTDSNKTSEEVPSGTLSYWTQYYWRVRYEDDHGYWSSWTDIWSFTTAEPEINPPNTPLLLSPSNGATDVSLTPTLSASSFSDPDSGDTHAASQWQVDNNFDFSSPVWDYTDTDSNKTSEEVPSGTLSYSTQYYWRVRYQDNHGLWSNWSSWRNFTTLPEGECYPPDTPEDLTASDGQYSYVQLRWDAAPGADYYCVYRSNFPANFGNATVLSGWIAETEYKDTTAVCDTYWVEGGCSTAGYSYEAQREYNYWVVARTAPDCDSQPSTPASGSISCSDKTGPFEPAIPVGPVDAARHHSLRASSLAVRLRVPAQIDPGSVCGVVNASGIESTAVDWWPVDAEEQTDGWVVYVPQKPWMPGDVVTMTVGATALDGTPIGPVTYEFHVATEAQRQEQLKQTLPQLWQPGYGDFDASTLDLGAECNDLVSVAEMPGDALPILPGAVGPLYELGPDQVFDTPQRVWLPLLEGVESGDVQLHYYHGEGDDSGWYPAGDIVGWLVPDSYLDLELNGTTYVGFLVRHSGIVQLGSADTAEPVPTSAAVFPPARNAVGDVFLFAVALVALYRRRTSAQSS